VSLLLQIDPKTPDPAYLERAAGVLRRGGILAYPTETLYGLGVDPFQEGVLEKLRLLKERPPNRPVSILVRDMEMLEEVVRDISPRARRILEAFLPGPLTAVLPARPHLPFLLTAGTEKIGVRISSHPLLSSLFEHFPHPITTTSANRRSMSPAVNAVQIADAFPQGIDCILDAGPIPGGTGSTVVDLTGREPVVLRAGAVSREDILRCVKESIPRDR
jgi:L-threonylcarbamoyladenylate synthase